MAGLRVFGVRKLPSVGFGLAVGACVGGGGITESVGHQRARRLTSPLVTSSSTAWGFIEAIESPKASSLVGGIECHDGNPLSSSKASSSAQQQQQQRAFPIPRRTSPHQSARPPTPSHHPQTRHAAARALQHRTHIKPSQPHPRSQRSPHPHPVRQTTPQSPHQRSD